MTERIAEGGCCQYGGYRGMHSTWCKAGQQPKKSRPQECGYHAVLAEIAKAIRRTGRDWSDEDVKRVMLEQFAHDTGRPTGRLLPSLDGQRLVQTHLQSRKFSKADASEFRDWLGAWAADNGIELSQ